MSALNLFAMYVSMGIPICLSVTWYSEIQGKSLLTVRAAKNSLVYGV